MQKSFKREGLLLTTTALTLAIASTAMAQGTPTEPAEIIVTAQKREQSLQDVPVAVSALGAEQLEVRRIESVRDLSSVAPNVQISRMPEYDANPQISIRGSSTPNPDQLQVGQPVGLYVDGIYVGGGAGSIFDVVDLERIEVLRGPQGTLYGRNTLAGAVNFITKKPSGEFSGKASVDIGNLNANTFKANVDLPRMGILSLAAGYRRERRDGWMDVELPTGETRDLGDRHGDGGRIAALLDFTDNVNALYTFDYSKSSQGAAGQLYRTDPAFWSAIGLDAFNARANRDRQTHTFGNATTVTNTEITAHGLTVSWDLGPAELKSITSQRKMKQYLDESGQDLDKTEFDIGFLAGGKSNPLDYEQFSQELQLVGATDKLNYVAGLYYFSDEGLRGRYLDFFFGSSSITERTTTEATSYAAYGQAEYHFTDRFSVTAGYRYTDEKQKTDSLLNGFTVADESTSSKATPLLVAAYEISDDVNVYARYAQGFKAGYVWQNNILVGLPAQVKPETLTSYEVGVKSRLFDRALTLNLTGFFNEKEDIQLSVFAPTSGGTVASGVLNAGSAEQWGIEVEAGLRPFEWLNLTATYGYLNSDYNEFIDKSVNQASNRVFTQAPEHTLSLGLDARLLQRDWGTVRYNMFYNYTSSFYPYPYQIARSGPLYDPTQAVAGDTRVKSVGIVNARLALTDFQLGSGSTTGELALWVNNLTDEDHVANFIDFGPAFGSLTTAFFNDPRTYGVTLSAKF